MNTFQLVKHHGFGNDFLIAFHVDLAGRRPGRRWRAPLRPATEASALTGC